MGGPGDRYRVIFQKNDGNLWASPKMSYAEAAWTYKTFANAIEVVKIATMPKKEKP